MRLITGVAAVVLAATLASCAPVPQTGPAPAPPAGTPSTTKPPGGTTPGTTAPAPAAPFRLDAEPSIEVGLAWDLDSLRLTPAKPQLTWRVGRAHDRATGRATVATIVLVGNRAELSVEANGAAVVSMDRSDTLWLGEPQDEVQLADPQIGWNRKQWRGQAKVFVNARAKLTIALRLPLESYLMGVVPGEIGGLSDSLLEAGRAQAIAARSYTLFYRGRRGDEGFDVYGTVEDQVYGSVESERPLATRCVKSTRGQLALYGGAPIRANYYSTCGGITADVWEAFPATNLAYLRSTRDGAGGEDYCARSPQYRWRETWDAGEFLDTVARFGPPEGLSLPASASGGSDAPGDLIDVRVASRSRSGRVWRLEIQTTNGTLVVPAYALRRVLRRPGETHPILRSNLFKIDVRRDPGTRRALSVVATGAGSGHGVGLCQTGALGMARVGKTGEAILEHYYPGATLKRMY